MAPFLQLPLITKIWFIECVTSVASGPWYSRPVAPFSNLPFTTEPQCIKMCYCCGQIGPYDLKTAIFKCPRHLSTSRTYWSSCCFMYVIAYDRPIVANLLHFLWPVAPFFFNCRWWLTWCVNSRQLCWVSVAHDTFVPASIGTKSMVHPVLNNLNRLVAPCIQLPLMTNCIRFCTASGPVSPATVDDQKLWCILFEDYLTNGPVFPEFEWKLPRQKAPCFVFQLPLMTKLLHQIWEKYPASLRPPVMHRFWKNFLANGPLFSSCLWLPNYCIGFEKLPGQIMTPFSRKPPGQWPLVFKLPLMTDLLHRIWKPPGQIMTPFSPLPLMTKIVHRFWKTAWPMAPCFQAAFDYQNCCIRFENLPGQIMTPFSRKPPGQWPLVFKLPLMTDLLHRIWKPPGQIMTPFSPLPLMTKIVHRFWKTAWPMAPCFQAAFDYRNCCIGFENYPAK